MAYKDKAFQLQADEAQICFDRDPVKMTVLGYPGAKMSLKEDDVPILFIVLEAVLTPSIRRTRTQSATRAATTTSLGSNANGSCKRTFTDTVSAIFYFRT